ncbi:ubiquinone/menaquinone biosynthesis C-methylase UbiE [Kribbella aluminosa]|uniref:Ubiquinone/menaquinone biosynthesis C-methylase UbiE n=1 Tax=Kribbella aluminosa TaxID=416017 RepID=A0ABS4UPR4_9ACTN|nr:class I SAM-dependent methyltransferase [Kribbella aluminosa]MBP2353629.1 ubiquinone/menaquinone biosynthesis C-methylase UbiE [Kribbella aluminosa]
MNDVLAEISSSYDNVAVSYAEMVQDGAPGEVEDLDLLAGLLPSRGLTVLDVGCGPGRVTAALHDRGLAVVGVDVSPGMVEVARTAHPEVDFRVGSMTALDLPDASVGGIVAWWSIIHLPRELVPTAFAEFRRVLAPGGVLLIGFHVGAESTHKTSGYGGHPMNVHVHRWTGEALTEIAIAAGFTPYAAELPDDRVLFAVDTENS